MKISGVSLYRVGLPAARTVNETSVTIPDEVHDSIIVKIETDEGISGLGEICTLGTYYMRGSADAAESGVRTLAPSLIGRDPFHVEILNREWDLSHKDDLYVKSALDMALWDIMARAAERPLSDLLGGSYEQPGPLYRSIWFPREAVVMPEDHVAGCLAARAKGFAHFQLKLGRGARADIAAIEATAAILQNEETLIADVNGRWTLSEAIMVGNAVRNLPVIIEQPCRTWEECIAFRGTCPLPVKLDEVIDTPQDIMRGFQTGAMDMIAIKIGKVGGPTRARKLRDLALALGLTIVPDDIWGSEIVSSCLLHFAASTDPKQLLCYTDLTDYVARSTAIGFPKRDRGTILPSREPGLGLSLNPEIADNPIAVFS
ncbi:MAG: enolase C-terminal domain-like protein [Pseudomonadota bacterium]